MTTINPRAERIIKNHVLISLGIAAIPIPMIDVILIYYVQMDMIKQLSEVYHKPFYNLKGKAYVGALASTSLARVGASLIKAIPGVGSIVGGLSSVMLSGASTYAVGQVTARFFQDHIDLADIDMDLAKALFKEEFEKGKKVAKALMKEKEKKKKEMTSEEYAQYAAKEKAIYQQLIELKSLRDKDIITEEEYEKMRKSYVDQLGL